MENFSGNQQKVKEKDVYSVNLDVPRIVLIISIFIGVIAASFLFGMHFVNQSEKKDASARNELFDPGKEMDILNKDLPNLPSEESAKPLDEKGQPSGDQKSTGIADKKISRESDLLKGEHIDKIITPAGEKKIAASEGKEIKSGPEADTEKVAAPDKKKPAKSKKANKKKKSVVAVSGDETPKSHGSAWAVQVASFDSKSKALSEVRSLKGLSHSAYVDTAKVSGKNYFRVRIGPLTKDRALGILNEIQGDKKYENSYVVKE